MVKDIGTCLFQSNCLSTCSRFVPPVLYLSVQSFFLFVCLSVPPSVHQYLCLCLPVCPYVRLSHTDCPAVYLFAFLTSLCLSVCLSVYCHVSIHTLFISSYYSWHYAGKNWVDSWFEKAKHWCCEEKIYNTEWNHQVCLSVVKFSGKTRIQYLMSFCPLLAIRRSVMNFAMNFMNCLGFSFQAYRLFFAISCDSSTRKFHWWSCLGLSTNLT